MSQPTEREIEIFNGALELPPGERTAYLDEACLGDPAMRQRITELLQLDDSAGAFLKTPAATPLPPFTFSHTDPDPVEKTGDLIGRYKLLQTIGEGGCGIVYLAGQEEPVRRRVALKVIKLGMDTKNVIARFEAERQALALMDHPNIARVLDAGATATGRPFFVMELVPGTKITGYSDQHHLSIHDRLDLFVQVCRAIEHSHQKGVIHRDIKPSNILVTIHDGLPLPKVIDFGIAKATHGKLTDQTLFTAFDQFIGTPAYMSPEQAAASAQDIDTRSDIYSLGVLLYELLAGHTPFDAKNLQRAGLDEIRRTIREDEPVRPSTRLRALPAADLAAIAQCRKTEPAKLIHLITGDLDWIVMKALEKDRTRRYETAHGLAADIQRYLHQEPVLACPPGNLYSFQKLMRRNKFAFLTAGLVLAMGILGLAGVFWQWRQAEFNARDALKQRSMAERNAAETRLNLYAADVAVAAQELQNGQPGLARQTLAALRPARGDTDLRGFEWRYLWNRSRGDELATLKGHAFLVSSAAFSPNGALLATGSHDGTVRIWNANQYTFLRTFRVTTNAVWSVAFTPDGRWLAAACNENVQLWDTTSWRLAASYPGEIAALPATGDLLATAESNPYWWWGAAGPVRLYNWRTGRLLARLDQPGRALALSSDGHLLAVAGGENGITVYDTDSRRVRCAWPTPLAVWSLRFSPDNRRLISTSYTNKVAVWTLDQPGPPALLSGHSLHVWSAVFSADGASIATTSSDQSVRLWDAATLAPKGVLYGHSSEVWCAAFNPAGNLLATGGKDRNIMLWPTTSAGPQIELPHDADVRPLFSPDGQSLVTVDPLVKKWMLWQVAGHSLVCRNLADGHDVCGFSQDGKCVAAFGTNHTTLQFWRPNGTRPEREITLAGAAAIPAEFDFTAMSPGQEVAFAIGKTGIIRIWSTDTGRLVNTVQGPIPPIRNAVMSVGGRQIAVSVESENLVHLYDCATGVDHELIGHTDFTSGLSFSPDGATLATGSMDGTIRLWNAASGALLATLPGHLQETTDVAFSPDGCTLASLAVGESLKLWHVPTRREVYSENLPNAGSYLRFSPDGRTLAVVTGSNKLRLLTAPPE